MKAIFALIALLISGLAAAQSYLLHPGTLYQSFDDTSAWKSADGTISADYSHVMQGSRSLMLTCTPGYSAHANKPISMNFANVSTISLWVYAQYPVSDDGWHACSLYLTPDGFADSFVAVSQKLRPGWSKLVFSKSDFAARGNPSWNSTMTTLQVALFGDTQNGMSISFDDMELNEYSRPKVIIAFDDNFASCYSYGYQYLKNYGFKGTAFVVSSWVDQPNRATTAQLNEMYNYGWDMCNHTTTHPDLNNLTRAQVDNEIQTCTNFLTSHGWTRGAGYLHLAYPQGHFNSTVLSADQDSGLLTARTTMKTQQADMVDSKYLLYSEVPDSTSQTRADIIARVDQVVNNGGALEITFHNITPTPQIALDWNDADFRAIIDYVAQYHSQGKLDVVTMTQWFQGLGGNPPTLTRVKTNALQTASGLTNTGYVYLSAAAGSPTNITLSPTSVAATVPSSVSIAAGASSASFAIGTTNVATATAVTIYARLNGVTQTCSFTVVPRAADHITIDTNPVVGGNTTWGHAYLNAPAPTGGCYVGLTSNSSAISVPAQVFVPAGEFHGDFPIHTVAVGSTTYANIAETYGGVTKVITLTVSP